MFLVCKPVKTSNCVTVSKREGQYSNVTTYVHKGLDKYGECSVKVYENVSEVSIGMLYEEIYKKFVFELA